jgi:hypothetical protein
MTRDEQADFERAFVAVSYFLGRRGDELTRHLSSKTAAAARLERALGAEEREARARALAAELGRIIAALEAQRLG